MTIYDILWLCVMPGMLLSLFYLARGVNTLIGKGKLVHNPYPMIYFLYAAKEVSSVLRESIDSVHKACNSVGLKEYAVRAAVVKDGDLPGADVIVVPESYECKSKYKARQLNYALKYLPDSSNDWILHLDEDAKILPQTVISILNYIKRGGNPVANGPTLFPYDGYLITYYVEAQRAWTYYWCKYQMETNAVYWMNGSNMLVRSDIEQAVGWSFKNCKFSEDTRFSYEVARKFGKVFGWHGGLTLEKPPKNIKGAIRQRMRWYWGGMLQLKYIPPRRLFRRIYSSIAWICGFFLTLLFPIGLIIQAVSNINLFSQTFLVFGFVSLTGIIWLIRYQYGLHINLKVSNLNTFKKNVFRLVLIPAAIVVEFICTVPTILSLINPPEEFEVTRKC